MFSAGAAVTLIILVLCLVAVHPHVALWFFPINISAPNLCSFCPISLFSPPQVHHGWFAFLPIILRVLFPSFGIRLRLYGLAYWFLHDYKPSRLFSPLFGFLGVVCVSVLALFPPDLFLFIPLALARQQPYVGLCYSGYHPVGFNKLCCLEQCRVGGYCRLCLGWKAAHSGHAPSRNAYGPQRDGADDEGRAGLGGPVEVRISAAAAG